ncbi:KxYKxGKxW signal peptide domain-containing protein [Lacticaseibacillus daqingensis]|uniref:KxYKxGKxW signal peptide domain-containing protein n=1 Tax=Lacticaseibacillus daqingensis TaxID=2486014 RepID=UPI000F77F84D|nr:KxYKxGKxW signal peptide domain-containing protein [Lacticaseibacillus daqingensis]
MQQTSKVHYKMYKAGKQWLVAGIAALGLGAGVATLNGQNVAAASAQVTNTVAPSTQVDPGADDDTLAAEPTTIEADQQTNEEASQTQGEATTEESLTPTSNDNDSGESTPLPEQSGSVASATAQADG